MSETESIAATVQVSEEEKEDTELKGTNESVEEEITYHAVEKDGEITAIWEMQGRKHLRTIHPRSAEGKKILSLFETAA
ncbi:MAG: hypothetical protein N2Z23_02350 [Pyrinomonadaceae bacterium]|nr:hypothetical protein [Pyrinomonadaceae bacterium]MCX7639272.1 hypothetical protein [Pyrinomonadaceae bacterium]MDW8303506.1 hypothetical protein [Acidobacteriota bacterium]